MVGCLGPSRPARDADVVARTVAAVALAALAVIHILDLPWTLGTIPLQAAIARRGPRVLRVPSGTVDDPGRPVRPIR
jgi:hypothetical protein